MPAPVLLALRTPATLARLLCADPDTRARAARAVLDEDERTLRRLLAGLDLNPSADELRALLDQPCALRPCLHGWT